jgi:hypothetical protein
MYKCYFGKPNIELSKYHQSANSRISILHKQISNVHMSIVTGPASQDAEAVVIVVLWGKDSRKNSSKYQVGSLLDEKHKF